MSHFYSQPASTLRLHDFYQEARTNDISTMQTALRIGQEKGQSGNSAEMELQLARFPRTTTHQQQQR